MAGKKDVSRIRRHIRLRKKILGTKDKPRLCVFRSLKHISASIIDDVSKKTILTASTQSKDIRAQIKIYDNLKAADLVGSLVAKKCLEKGINKVVFDRGGYIYHGRIKAVADSARKAGLQF